MEIDDRFSAAREAVGDWKREAGIERGKRGFMDFHKELPECSPVGHLLSKRKANLAATISS